MARNKGTFSYAANYEMKLQAALDPRITVEKKEDLTNKETWPYDGNTIYLYEGLVVSVQEENALYMLIDKNNITNLSGWYRMNDYVDDAIRSAITDALTTDL